MTVGPGYGYPPADHGRMLASTADRERALDVLRAGFAEGRLTKDEYDERVGSTYAARTYADLAAVTAGLPGGQWPAGQFGSAVMQYPPTVTQYPPAVTQYPPTASQYPPAGGPWPGMVSQYAPGLPQYRPAVQAYWPVRHRPRTNPLANASVWCGFAGLVLGLPSIAALFLGSAALRQIRRTGEAGAGQAATGLVLGFIGIIVIVLRVVIAVHGA